MNELMEALTQFGQNLLSKQGLLLGLVVAIILMVRDFRGVAMPLVREAITNVESYLAGQAGEEKLRTAVNYVLDFLPMPYKLLVPRTLVVKLVQAVFNREYASIFSTAKRTVLLKSNADPLSQPAEAPTPDEPKEEGPSGNP